MEKVRAEPSRVLAEVVKLFGKGKQPADPGEMKRLLQGCLDQHDYLERYDNQTTEFYESLDRFFDYADQHRLSLDALEDVRTWVAMSRDVDIDPSRQGVEANAGDNQGESPEPPFADRMSMMNSAVWRMVRNNYGECRPRHAVLMSVLCPVHVFMPGMRSCVFYLHEKLEQGNREKVDLNDLEKFFLEEAHAGLRMAVRDEDIAVRKPYEMPSYRGFGEHAQECLEHKTDAPGFKQHLQQFRQHFEKVVHAVPGYAVEDRYALAQYLRAVWNMVHAYGDEQDKESLRTYVVGLRDHYGRLSDPVTVKWMNQVMAKAGQPPEVLMETVTLVPVDRQTK